MSTSPIKISTLLARRESKVVVVTMIVLVIWVLSGNLGDDDTALQDNAAEQTRYVPEVAVKPSVAEPFVRELTLSAVTENRRAVDVSTQTSGIIDNVIAKEGQSIRQGDIIAVLKADARAEKIAQAKAELEQRKIEYRAAKKLAKSGLRAETALAETYFLMKQAQTNLKEATLDADYGNIISPFDGILNKIHIHEGDIVKSLETPVAEVLDVNPMLVAGYVPEKWRRDIRPGISASVSLSDEELIYGTVDYVSLKADAATRTFKIEVAVDNTKGHIPAGITCKIHIPLGNINAHYVPSSALSLSDEGELQIKHLGDGNIVLATSIEIAGEDANGLWVTGLPKHINLITYGQAFVQAGEVVKTGSGR